MEGGLEAIVVGSVDVGDSSRIVRLLCERQGRISVMARSARTSKKRFAGALEVGTALRAQLRKGRGELHVLVQAERISGPKRAREELERLALLAYGCEICAMLAPEDAAAPRLTGLLRHWLELLEGETRPGTCTRLALEAKALTFAGLTPMLVACSRCGQPIEESPAFDPDAGGALHTRCGGGEKVSRAALVEMEALRRTPMASSIGRRWEHGSRWLLADFATYHLAKALRSRSLLETLEDT